MSNDFEQEQLLFNLCVDEPAERWPAILEQHTADPALRDRVLKLLQHHSDTAARESGFLRLDPADPERIGPYRILQRLGEGGMGIVYAAEQREPVRRRVAIKVLRSGHSREVLARFDAERQALSLMNHPGIARILDAGTTADQRPYIVMEYVSGEPITRYCRHRELALEMKLELFRQVCDAVQHAHQKGIIHRDLKPSNILVTEELGKPAPKVIDFGIAKAMTLRLTDHTLETKVGSFLGTPDYMSPEQADISPIDVDTRADVYALGAILYELLTGTTPFQVSKEQHSWTEIQRILREQEAAPPSRRTSQRLPRELDWITCKALEKDRNRRYATAAEFANDISAYLESLPIQAGPRSRFRAFRRLARRHRLATTIVAAAVLLVSVSQAVLIRKNQELAIERDRANTEAAIAKSVTRFTARLFELANPQETNVSDITAQQLLALGIEWLETEGSEESPEVLAALYAAAGKAYHGIGLHDESAELAQKAVNIFRSLEAPDIESMGDALMELSHSAKEHGKFEQAERFAQEAVSLAGDDYPAFGYRARVELADVKRLQSNFTEAARILEGLLADNNPAALPDDRSDALLLLGRTYSEQGRFEEAGKLILEVLRLETNPDGSLTSDGERAKSALASLYAYQGKTSKAIALNEQLVENALQRYGPMHSETATAWNNLGYILLDAPERHNEAEDALLQALKVRRHVSEPDDPGTLTVLSNLSWLYGSRGNWEKAHQTYNEILQQRRKTLGDEHLRTAIARIGVGRSLLELGKPQEAEAHLKKALVTVQETVGARHWRVGAVRSVLGLALMMQGREEEAGVELRNGYELLLVELGAEHAETRKAEDALRRFEERETPYQAHPE